MNRHTRVRRKKINKTKIKINKTKKYKKGGALNDLIDKSSKNTEEMIKNADLAADLSKVGHAVIIGLTLSGVGVPFVGLVGAVFIISNQLLRAKEQNLILRTVLNDVIVIITNNFRLYKVINKSIQIIEKHKENHNNVQSFIIDSDVIRILYEKMLYLFENLLEISPTEVIKELVNDKSINSNTKLKDIIESENTNRTTGVMNTLSSLRRVFKRNVNVEKTTNEIVKNISVINGYFMIMKSQFDMATSYYQRNLPIETTFAIWKEIETDDSFKDFLLPDDKKTGKKILDEITDQHIAEEDKLNNKLRIIYKENYFPIKVRSKKVKK
jgi:hypothetical protein